MMHAKSDTISFLQEIINNLEHLSETANTEQQFFDQFMSLLVRGLAAKGGAIWALDPSMGLVCVHSDEEFRQVVKDCSEETEKQHGQLLKTLVSNESSVFLPPSFEEESLALNPNPLPASILFSSIAMEGKTKYFVELLHRENVPTTSQRGHQRFTERACKIAASWFRNQEVSSLRERLNRTERVRLFCQQTHRSLDSLVLAHYIANETKQITGCERVSLLLKKNGKLKVAAVSGQESIEHRATVVKHMKEVAKATLKLKKPLWYPDEDAELSDHVLGVIDKYVDVSETKCFAVYPLEETYQSRFDLEGEIHLEQEMDERTTEEPEFHGVLFVEQFNGVFERPVLERELETLTGHVEIAVSNASFFDRLLFSWIWRRLGTFQWLMHPTRKMKTLAISGIVAAVVLFLCLFPMKLQIESRGVLQPIENRTVFAEVPGVIDEISVEDGEFVEANQDLFAMKNPDLSSDWLKTVGDLKKNDDDISALTRELTQASSAMSRVERVNKDGELNSLKGQKLQLTNSLDVLNLKMSALGIQSRSSGIVTLSKPIKELIGRPVTLGDSLATVVNPDGPWQLELLMPEHNIDHIVLAQQRLGENEPLTVEFILATDPTKRYIGTVKSIHPVVQPREEEGSVLQVIVEMDKDDIDYEPRPGASAVGQINCGYRSAGYVWFHEGFEWVQRTLLF